MRYQVGVFCWDHATIMSEITAEPTNITTWVRDQLGWNPDPIQQQLLEDCTTWHVGNRSC
jgi:hypothetical protein